MMRDQQHKKLKLAQECQILICEPVLHLLQSYTKTTNNHFYLECMFDVLYTLSITQIVSLAHVSFF